MAGPLTTFLPPPFSLLRFSMMLGGLGDHAAAVVEPLAAGAAGDLLEVADREDRDLAAVELRELGEEHGADRDVDPHPQGVGAGDDPQQPLLGELLDQQAVLGEEPRVVDSDPEARIAPEFLAVGRVEAEIPHRVADRVAVLAGGDLHAGERLRQLGAFALGEVDHVDRRLAGLDQGLHGLVQRRLEVLEVEGDGAVFRAGCGPRPVPVTGLDVLGRWR